MHQTARTGRCWVIVGVLAALSSGACGDDATVVTATEGSTGSSSTTDNPPTTTNTPTTDVPTTTDTPTTTDVPTTTDTPTTVTTETTDTTDSTTGTTTEGVSTTDTSSTTDDTTGGAEVVGRSVTQTVNSGTVAISPNFRMVFTLGQPTQNQGVYTSTNFRLQGGLIGANGNPP